MVKQANRWDQKPRRHWLLLLVWTVLGLALRLFHLTDKPLWTDEFSTIVFSLGNSFLTVPLNQAITSGQLLQPLQPIADHSLGDVLRHLFTESNHPPLYFLLTHIWLQGFPTDQGWASVWGARALSALCGAIAVPALYGIVGWAFRQRTAAHIAAALMATSPFGIYLAQEARHYTLPVLWILASLACLLAAVRRSRDRQPLAWKICFAWVLVNSLGIATHYLFSFCLLAEAILLMGVGLLQSWREQGQWYPSTHWWRIVAVAVGTLVGAASWLPLVSNINDSALTRWIEHPERHGLDWLDPIGQSLAAGISMIGLLPIQAPVAWGVALSAAGLIGLTLWGLPKLHRGLRQQWQDREARLAIWVLGSYTIAIPGLFWLITYGFDRDLTSALRYNFVYFPAVIALVAAAFASHWQGLLPLSPEPSVRRHPLVARALRWYRYLSRGNRRTVGIVACVSLLGALTVLGNWGYQKTHRPDLVAQDIRIQAQASPAAHTLVAIGHQTHGQTGRLMGVAWELAHHPDSQSLLLGKPPLIQFLLAHYDTDGRSALRVLRQTLNQQSYPLDLWLINRQDLPDAPLETLLDRHTCTPLTDTRSVDGYRYRPYRCLTP